MQRRFQTAVALSLVLATAAPAMRAFARAETKVEQHININERNEATEEQLLKIDGSMREHTAKITAHCKTPMEVARKLLDEISGYGNEEMTQTGITANAQRTFYLKRGFCSSRSYLFIALFNERMKELEMNAEARLCEIYRNDNAFRTIPHVAVAVIEGDHTVIFDPTLNRIIDRRFKPIAAKVLNSSGVLSNHFVNLAAIEGGRNPVKAEELARTAIKIEPRSAFAHYAYVLYLVQNRKLNEAKEEAEKVVKLAPTWPNGYETFEDILSKLGLKNEKNKLWEIRIKVMPDESWDINKFLREMGYKSE